jgi:hypothetical protein
VNLLRPGLYLKWESTNIYFYLAVTSRSFVLGLSRLVCISPRYILHKYVSYSYRYNGSRVAELTDLRQENIFPSTSSYLRHFKSISNIEKGFSCPNLPLPLLCIKHTFSQGTPYSFPNFESERFRGPAPPKTISQKSEQRTQRSPGTHRRVGRASWCRAGVKTLNEVRLTNGHIPQAHKR